MIIIVSSFCFAIPLLIILLFPRYFADIINDVFQWFCGAGDASVGYLVISLSASLMLPFMPVSGFFRFLECHVSSSRSLTLLCLVSWW